MTVAPPPSLKKLVSPLSQKAGSASVWGIWVYLHPMNCGFTSVPKKKRKRKKKNHKNVALPLSQKKLCLCHQLCQTEMAPPHSQKFESTCLAWNVAPSLSQSFVTQKRCHLCHIIQNPSPSPKSQLCLCYKKTTLYSNYIPDIWWLCRFLNTSR